jgi:hypothetical protein
MKTTAEIYIAMNEDGDFEVGINEEEASERLMEHAGGQMIRIVKIAAKMTPPAITEAAVDVPDEAGETTEVETA